jgi:hypothetical protein
MIAPFGLKVTRTRALDAVLARRAYGAKWGKAYKIFTIIAKGFVDFPQRRAPTAQLIEMFERSKA